MGRSIWYQEKMRTVFSGGSVEQYSVKEENQKKVVVSRISVEKVFQEVINIVRFFWLLALGEVWEWIDRFNVGVPDIGRSKLYML